MKERLVAPLLTTFGSPESIARNVGAVSLCASSVLEERTLEIERIGNEVRWHQGSSELVFSLKAVSALEVVDAEYADEHFVALALTFASRPEVLRYKMITSHISEVGWLNDSAARIGQLFSLPVARAPMP